MNGKLFENARNLFSPLPAWKRYFQIPLKKGRPFAAQLYYFSLLLNFFQVSRLFYDWHEALKVARKHKELTDGQMIHHNRRVKRGCMQEWKKFTLKSRAEKHCNKTVTSKVWICYRLYSNLQLSMSNCSGFALLRPVIGPENSWHPLNQSNAKLKTITTWSPAFSRALGSLLVFTLSSHWLLVTFSFALIGCCDNFGLRRSVEMRC